MNTSGRIRRMMVIAAFTSGVIMLIPSRSIVIRADAEPQVVSNPIQDIRGVAILKQISPNDLLAISAQESSLGKHLIGDGGCSRGWYQINLCANPDAVDLIGDPVKEAAWAADKLIGYGYLTNRTLAIARYNSPVNPNYAYAALVDKRLGELDVFLKPYQSPPEP